MYRNSFFLNNRRKLRKIRGEDITDDENSIKIESVCGKDTPETPEEGYASATPDKELLVSLIVCCFRDE